MSPELVTGGRERFGYGNGVLTVVLGGAAEKNLVLVCRMCRKRRVEKPGVSVCTEGEEGWIFTRKISTSPKVAVVPFPALPFF